MTEHENIQYNKYLIFLSNRYFVIKKKCFVWRKYAHNVVEELTDKGITVCARKNIKDYLSYYFDEDTIPKINTLYVHLMNGEYYSDELYSKKKMEREREILFLLAAKLGVSTIDYETEVTETKVSMLETSLKIKNIENTASFNKTITKSNGQAGKEIYLNRGAPVYCLSKHIRQVENNIKKYNKLDSRIFSYEVYKNSNKLTCFVYKRYNFKMLALQYTSETEDIIDKSFEVKTTLLDYGIGISFKENSIFTEKITYKLTFFNDKELRLKLTETIRMKHDPFAIVREVYESQENKDIAVFRIAEYVRKYTFSCGIKYISHNDIEQIDMGTRFDKWVKNSEKGEFEGICHGFISTYQIRNWLYTTLLFDGEERIECDDDADISVMELQNRHYDRYKEKLMSYDDSGSDDSSNNDSDDDNEWLQRDGKHPRIDIDEIEFEDEYIVD